MPRSRGRGGRRPNPGRRPQVPSIPMVPVACPVPVDPPVIALNPLRRLRVLVTLPMTTSPENLTYLDIANAIAGATGLDITSTVQFNYFILKLLFYGSNADNEPLEVIESRYERRFSDQNILSRRARVGFAFPAHLRQKHDSASGGVVATITAAMPVSVYVDVAWWFP